MSVNTTPGYPGANSSASGGKVYAYNAITNASNTIVAPANPQRTEITFHNPGTNDILISPTVALTIGSGQSTLTPTTGALGGGFRVFANGGSLTVTGECQQSWQALALAGTTNPLTVMDSNI